MASADSSARGTVRAGSRTSPLGTSAISRPTNAKISKIDVLPMLDADGSPGQRRYSALTDQRPTPTKISSGSSFRSAVASTSLTAGLTPRTLMAARAANRPTMIKPRPTADSAGGQSAPIDPANALATDATANVAIRQ